MYIDILRFPGERRHVVRSLVYTALRLERDACLRLTAVSRALDEYVAETRGFLEPNLRESGWTDLARMREHFLVEMRARSFFTLGELVFVGFIFSSRYPNPIFEALMEVDREVYENPYLALPELLMERYQDSRVAEERAWLLFILDGIVGTVFSRFAEAPASPAERRIISRHYRNLERIADFVRTMEVSRPVLQAPEFLQNLFRLASQEDWRQKLR